MELSCIYMGFNDDLTNTNMGIAWDLSLIYGSYVGLYMFINYENSR
jgi:hypothetical protein